MHHNGGVRLTQPQVPNRDGLRPRRYPNGFGENFREERNRLLDETHSGDSTARNVYACLLHAKEVRALLVLLRANNGADAGYTRQQAEIFKALEYELSGYKLRATRMNDDG